MTFRPGAVGAPLFSGPHVRPNLFAGARRVRRWLPAAAAAFLAAAVICACGGSKKHIEPPPPPTTEGLFWEPRAYCLPISGTGDTLFVSNFGDSSGTWHTVHVPAGSTNLNHTVTVGPDSTIAMVWTWIPEGTSRVVDSLVAETTDPAHPRIAIPFVRESADYVDAEPPPAPVLGQPDAGATFRVGNTIRVVWTRVSDCSGILRYDLQVATDPAFHTIVLADKIGISEAGIDVEPDDAGKAAWLRVRAVDKTRLPGLWSEPRSWTVEP